jgi:hypothetical protein
LQYPPAAGPVREAAAGLWRDAKGYRESRRTAGTPLRLGPQTCSMARTGLVSGGNQFWNQDSPGILDSAEFGDVLGVAVA